ncbi:MAG: nitrile hydratase subunit beta [Acetobacteraceae bacterium]|nr:nitrile hydratase subunit beta [Acetobacteraceae bacterium]
MSTIPSPPDPATLPEAKPRAHHDMGGVSKFMCDAVDVEPHVLNDFDREVDAIRALLGARKVMSVDELRRGIEAIPEADYLRLSYYQRWIRSITDNMLARGVFSEAELRAALEDTK